MKAGPFKQQNDWLASLPKNKKANYPQEQFD